MVLGHFPRPYEDELLISVLARYALREGSSARDTMRSMFGPGQTTAVVDLPAGLATLCRNLGGSDAGLSPESVRDQHTLWPFYRPFLVEPHRSEVLSDMHGHSGLAIHARCGILAARIPTPAYFRFCPACRADDVGQVGEPYWHRMHQLPGILLCPKHEIPLWDSALPRLLRTHRQRPVLLEETTEGVPIAVNPKTMGHHRDLARHVTALFSPIAQQFTPTTLQARYVALLVARDMAAHTGRVRQQDFRAAFYGYFGTEFLASLWCTVPSTDDQWLARLVRKPLHSNHPLHHLLLWCFLDLSGTNSPTEQANPFGPGPWPCLNHAASHYRQRIIDTCRIHRHQGGVTGDFWCRCGFGYQWTGPDSDPTTWDRPRHILDVGPVWLAQLRELSGETHRSLRSVARDLGVDPRTVLRYRECTDGPDYKGTRQFPETRYRANWVSMVAEHGGIKSARSASPKGYMWLYRHDHDWLLEFNRKHCWERTPALATNERTIARWERRDEILSQQIEPAVGRLHAQDPPTRVTLAAVARQVDTHDWIGKHADRLPRTMAALRPLLEDPTAFRHRRLVWAVQYLRKNGSAVARWQVLRLAGIRSDYVPSIASELEQLSASVPMDEFR